LVALFIFATEQGSKQKKQEDITGLLYQQIGQLKVELDWVKKSWNYQLAQRKN